MQITMRRLILLPVLVLAICLASCENTEDSSPALQGQLDDFFYKATDARGTKNDDGTVTLQGVTQSETLTLHLRGDGLGTYPLGPGEPNYARFEDNGGNMFSTTENGSGEIVITDRCISCGWLTGTFNFTAIQTGVDTLNMNKGVFFRVSFLSGQLPSDTPQQSDGGMTAEVNGDDYEANNVSADLVGDVIKIEGFKDNQIIELTIPSDGVPGNYDYPSSGFSASLFTDGIEDPAVSGLISINFNNTATREARVFFSFMTEGGEEVTLGNTRVDY